MSRPRTLPAGPVKALLLARIEQAGNVQTVARLIGKDRNAVVKVLASEQLTLFMADEFAIRLGMHPALLWGRLWEEGGQRSPQVRPEQCRRGHNMADAFLRAENGGQSWRCRTCAREASRASKARTKGRSQAA